MARELQIKEALDYMYDWLLVRNCRTQTRHTSLALQTFFRRIWNHHIHSLSHGLEEGLFARDSNTVKHSGLAALATHEVLAIPLAPFASRNTLQELCNVHCFSKT